MPVRFTCPHCGATTNVSDEYAGQSGPCAQCGQMITVPPAGPVPGYGPPQKRSVLPIVLAVLGAVLVGFLACGGILVALMMPAVGSAREAARRALCNNQLKQIGLALHNYHDVYGCFPPAYIQGRDGKPMHSWRVLILPYLERQDLYRRYDFNEPWNGPHNRALANLMPDVYRCPSDAHSGPGRTSYLAIVAREDPPPGATPAFVGQKATRRTDFPDGSSNTIMIVEAAGAGINWMEPRDLDAEQLPMAVNSRAGGGIRSDHPQGANALFGDGCVRFLPDRLDRETLRRLIYRDDGQPVDFGRF